VSVQFREARREEVPQIVALLADDMLGAGRETEDMALYYAAFDAMRGEADNLLIVGVEDGRVVATYQLTFISGLSLRAARRAQLESVRVSAEMRGRGLGAAMMRDAEERARAAGCALLQLTTNAGRDRARAFYDRLGYAGSHIGYKYPL